MAAFKILTLALSVTLLFPLGCGRKVEPDESHRKKILCTIAQIGNLVSDLGGDRIEVQVLVRGELNPHTYELVKGDDEKIRGADLIFYNGLGLEHGASLSAMLRSHPNGFAVGDSIVRLHPEKILWVEQTMDPHIWMDISLWAEGIDPMLQALIALDPEGREGYLERGQELKKKLELTDAQVFEKIQTVPEDNRFLVTSHDAFQYFTRRYLSAENDSDWNKRFKAPEGLSPDGQLNPLDLQKIVDHLSFYGIHVLFPEANVSRDSIRKIADAGKKVGLKIRISPEVLYGDSVKGNYLEAMMHNADAIARSLSENENG
jgi:manganese/zinc/iron transport system substrate-binding protein